jgi:hypothetical protein
MKKFLLLPVLMAACTLCAQEPANFAWWNTPLRNDIGLSEAQNQKLREIVRSYRERLLDSRNNALKARSDLEEVLNGVEVNADQAKSVIERVATARAESSRVFLQMSMELRGVLTLDQWRELVRRREELQRKKQTSQGEP